ncbi:MAG: putative monovalent cation/H+ antiporter subunit A [Chloroflexi bacterium]|nr:putative monovalent cation/H+ antiporter subunit A [Chloroflexota bacterium]
MAIAIISSYILAMFVPWLQRACGIGRVLFLVPLSLTVYFAALLPAVFAGETLLVSLPWIPSLGVNLSFYVDGLSLLFALLIAGIGAIVFLYAGSYMKHHQYQGRFFTYMLVFMASMLGLVTSGNVISLFVFWELTSVSSYLLIGLNHSEERSRYAALQALLVTGIGGLALLTGLIILGGVSGSLEVAEILSNPDALRGDVLYLPVLLLILAGAFTKSAQFPFHFWLPNAMEAPTPVSAYLHSATMVKAGVFLLARLSPVLGGTDAWFYIVTGVGAVTMVAGALLALNQTDSKRLLAYSTVSALGMLTMLLGIGTEIAVKAAVAVLLAHAFYKGALFLIAGAVDHETGTRDVTVMKGLARAMPVTAAAAVAAGLSMAGVLPAFGFIAKEIFYEAATHSTAAVIITIAAVIANAALFTVVLILTLRPFWGRPAFPEKVHEPPPALWLGPLVLAGLGLGLGVIPGLANPFLSAAVSAVLGREITVGLALWHGFTPELALSALTLLTGLGLYLGHKRLGRIRGALPSISRIGPERVYDRSIDGMLRIAELQTRILQNGRLRTYLMIVFMTTVALTAYTLVRFYGIPSLVRPGAVAVHELIVAAAMLVAAAAIIRLRSLLSAVAAMGIVGYGTALVYVFFGAPDLAMTQFLIETLTVVLFVFGFYHLPRSARRIRFTRNIGGMVVALAVGALVTLLLLAGTTDTPLSELSAYFAANSYTVADGKNVVNVILVDFRALDTLGEIVVLAIAGIGVFALLKLRIGGKRMKE